MNILSLSKNVRSRMQNVHMILAKHYLIDFADKKVC